jgi:hypothetical protein
MLMFILGFITCLLLSILKVITYEKIERRKFIIGYHCPECGSRVYDDEKGTTRCAKGKGDCFNHSLYKLERDKV